METDSPQTEKREPVETLHGVDIFDPYRWLEGDNEAVEEWVTAQNEYADSHLDTATRDELQPRFESLAKTAEFSRSHPRPSAIFSACYFPATTSRF